VQDDEATNNKTRAHISTPTKKRIGEQEAKITEKMKYHKNTPNIIIT